MDYETHALRDRGHRLIEEISKTGLSRGQIYSLLTRRMRYNFHYAQRNEPNELIHANMELLKILMARNKKFTNKMRKRKQWEEYKDKVFTDKEVLREVGRLNTERIRLASLPWWRRWCAKLFDI